MNYRDRASQSLSINGTGVSVICEASNGYQIFIEAANKEVNKGFASINSVKYIKDSGNEVVPVYLGKGGEGYDIYWAYKDRVVADGGTVVSASEYIFKRELHKILHVKPERNVDLPITEADLQGLQAEERIMLLP